LERSQYSSSQHSDPAAGISQCSSNSVTAALNNCNNTRPAARRRSFITARRLVSNHWVVHIILRTWLARKDRKCPSDGSVHQRKAVVAIPRG